MSYGPTGRVPTAMILAGLLALCSAPPLTARVPREAASELESETLQLILGMERQAAPGCPAPSLVKAEPSPTEPSSDAWQERWLLDRCGALIVYDVRYARSGRGSIDLGVALAEADGQAHAGLTPAWAEIVPERDPSYAPAGRTLRVTNTGDSGPGSLTQAILDVNAFPNQVVPDRILFDIPGSGPHVIALTAPLPAITEPVIIDGYSQPGARESDSEVPVEIDGTGLDRFAHGLLLRGGSSTVRGLRIHGFHGDSIRIEKGGANRIEGNLLAEGDAGPSEGSGIAIVDSSLNRIGGAETAAGNVIEGHGGSGVSISGVGSVGNTILGNRILRNAGDGIDLDGETSGTAQADAKANHGRRSPLLTSASFTPARDGRQAEVVVEGRLEGEAGTSYRVELFATSAEEARAPRTRQGERFLASIEVTAASDGRVGFQLHLPQGVRSRDLLTATATDAGGDTSEFSEPLFAPTITHTWNAGTGGWGTAGNWNPPQVPAMGDDVVIAANGVNTTFTVTLDVAANINALTLGGGSGTQTLAIAGQTLTLGGASTVTPSGALQQSGGTIGGTGGLTINGSFNWSGGIMTGAATTTVGGPFSLSGIVGINGGRTLTSTTTVVWTAGAGQGVRTGTGSVINNNGVWDAQVDGGVIANFYGGASTFNNSGTFKKSAGAGSTGIGVPFANTGTLDVQSGTINLSGGGSSTNALKASVASSTLLFSAGTFDLSAGTAVSGPGTISLNSSGTLNVNAALSVPAGTTFNFQAGTLAGTATLTTNGTFNWSGGAMSGAGITTVNGPFNLSGLTGVQNGRTLNNATTCAWTSGAGQGIWTGTGSVINNTGTWDVQVDGGAVVNHYGGVTTFNNSGTFKKSAGAGSTSMAIPFANTGTVDAQSGTIELSGGGSSTNVLRASGATSTLLFSAGTFDLNAGTSITGPGTILFNSGGTLNVNTALSVPVGTTFTFQAGTLAGTGTLTTNGTLNWSGGLMSGAGITTVNGPFNLSGLVGILNGRTLNNATTCAWTSGASQGMWTGTGSVINNTGTWDAQVDGGAIVNHYGGATTFNNSSTFKKSAGAGSTIMAIPFTNTGTVDVRSGTVNFQADGTNSNMLKVSGASSTLLFSIGTFNLNAGTAVSGPGTILLNSSGTLNVNAALSIPAATTFTFLAGTLAGTATLTTNGTFNWSGGLMTGAAITNVNGPFNLSGLVGILNGRTLNNAATCAWTSGAGQGMWTGTGSVINNSGTWDAPVDGGAIVNHYGGATTFNNSGTFTKSAGAGSTSVSIPFTNTGTVDAHGGTLNMSSSSYTQTAGTTRLTGGALTSTTTVAIQGGTLAGSGTVTAPVVVSGTGALAPGLSPGTLNIVGNYTQQAPNAAFNVELGGTTPGTQFDLANVSGTGVATLAGTLNVSLIGGFVPSPGDSFTILTYVSRTGTFNLNLPTFSCSGWRTSYGPTALVLTFVALPTEVSSLIFTSDTGLAWDPGLVGPPLSYDVLRGMLDHQPVSTGGGQICLASAIATQSTSDVAVPAVGSGFWYLVRERRTGCGIGTYGFATNGVERTSTTCP